MTTTAHRKANRFLLYSLSAAIALGGLALLRPSAEVAAEEAAKGPSGRRWTLGFTHGPLRRVTADDGRGHAVTMLYMTMTVENKTGLARAWRPLVRASTDTRPAPYVAAGYPLALEKIRAQEGNSELEAIDTTGWKKGDEGNLADGAKRSVVAIFGPIDPYWAKFTIDAEGLVNSITTLKVERYDGAMIVAESAYAARNAKAWEEIKAAAKAKGAEVASPVGEYIEVLERRSFRITYKRQGDEFQPDDDPLEFVSEGWHILDGSGDAPNPKILRTIKAN